MSVTPNFDETIKVGANDDGYEFWVGRTGDRWLGFAVGKLHQDGTRGMFVFPELIEDFKMGLADRDDAIRMTGAVAQAVERGYGGIARWSVPIELRGDPEDYRCGDCGDLGCNGECLDECLDEWDDFYLDEAGDE